MKINLNILYVRLKFWIFVGKSYHNMMINEYRSDSELINMFSTSTLKNKVDVEDVLGS